MPDPQNGPDKTKKSRGLGAFLVFLSILVIVLWWLGPDRYRPRQELTQDQYEYHLVRGEIVRQELKGESLIEGVRKGPGIIEGQQFFKVQYPSLAERAEDFRALKAVPVAKDIFAAPLEYAVKQGWYDPVTVRAMTVHHAEGETPPTPNAEVQRTVESQLFVEVRSVASGVIEAHYEAQRRSGQPLEFKPADFPTPPVSGPLYLAVLEVEDLGGTIGALASAGGQVENYSFDLATGTIWKPTDSLFGSILLFWGPWILIFVVFMFFMRQMRSQGGAGGVMSFGRSRAQLYQKESHTNVTFGDVAGAQEAKEEVREIVEFLKNPSRFTRIGGRIPRGVLLVGPPGCGKTLLAKAIAGEAEVPFFSISGSDFVEMFVGVGASRVRDLFKQARENSPCIIFLDEIDAVGRRRGSGLGGGHDEREQTLNAILVEMDGFSTDEGIIVVAATNRPDVLDPALLRPGRFDREVVIDLPDAEGRRQILGVHLKKVKHGPECDLDTLARSTPGYSGADLAAIINEAAIRAALDKREEINMEDLEEARDKVRFGRQKKSRHIEEEDRKITAYHEAGHAIVAAKVPEVEHPHKVTIVPRGRALGATMVLPDKESYHMQKRRMLGQLAMLFGGRVAEVVFCGDISAGASDDIKRATDLARAMVTELGMSDKIGPVNYAEREGNDFLGTELMRGRSHSEETAREIDEEVGILLREAYARAEEIVRSNEQGVERLTQALLAYETISKTEIEQLLGGSIAVEDLRPKVEDEPEAHPEAPAPPKGDRRNETGDLKGDLPGEPGLSPA